MDTASAPAVPAAAVTPRKQPAAAALTPHKSSKKNALAERLAGVEAGVPYLDLPGLPVGNPQPGVELYFTGAAAAQFHPQRQAGGVCLGRVWLDAQVQLLGAQRGGQTLQPGRSGIVKTQVGTHVLRLPEALAGGEAQVQIALQPTDTDDRPGLGQVRLEGRRALGLAQMLRTQRAVGHLQAPVGRQAQAVRRGLVCVGGG